MSDLIRLDAIGSPASGRGAATGSVDWDRGIITGITVAVIGPFCDGRGEFDDHSLELIFGLMKDEPLGLKSHFGHAALFGPDPIGTFLGRASSPRISGDRVLADLKLDPSSFVSPQGDLGKYVMTLAKSDGRALAASLVLKTDIRPQLNDHGRPMLDAVGDPLPPLWYPTALAAVDLVDHGAATDGLLGSPRSPREHELQRQREVAKLLRPQPTAAPVPAIVPSAMPAVRPAPRVCPDPFAEHAMRRLLVRQRQLNAAGGAEGPAADHRYTRLQLREHQLDAERRLGLQRRRMELDAPAGGRV